jgi:uncharacterized membrane protein (GlpM family)
MFWITFFVSGLTVASIPWIANHFSNRIAGYVVLVPVMMTLSLIVQYLSHGPKAATEMISGTLLALPTLLVFGLLTIILIKQNFSLPLVVFFSIAGWVLTVLAINSMVSK